MPFQASSGPSSWTLISTAFLLTVMLHLLLILHRQSSQQNMQPYVYFLLLVPVQVAFVADRHPMSPAWVHDFAATDKYAIIIEHPLYMQLGSLLLNTPATHIFSKCRCAAWGAIYMQACGVSYGGCPTGHPHCLGDYGWRAFVGCWKHQAPRCLLGPVDACHACWLYWHQGLQCVSHIVPAMCRLPSHQVGSTCVCHVLSCICVCVLLLQWTGSLRMRCGCLWWHWMAAR